MWIRGKLKLETSNDPILINNKELEYTNVFKYLGLWIDNKLSFDDHLSNLQAKLIKQSKAVVKCRKYLNAYQSVFLFKTLLLPLFDYADIFYNSSSQSHLSHLQTIQNKILRACHNKKERTNTNHIHEKYNILTLTRRRKLHLAKWGFQLAHNKTNLKAFKRALRKNGKKSRVPTK